MAPGKGPIKANAVPRRVGIVISVGDTIFRYNPGVTTVSPEWR